jgi:hypothetical protein
VNQAQENITHMSSYNIPHVLSYKACVFDLEQTIMMVQVVSKFLVLNPNHMTE